MPRQHDTATQLLAQGVHHLASIAKNALNGKGIMTRHISRRLRKLLEDVSGANFVEAALILPLVLLVTFGVMDFATLCYEYLALENGVAQATRFVVTGQQMADPANPGTFMNRQNSIKAAMRMATPTLDVPDGAFTFQHMAPGAGSWSSGVGGPGDLEKVTINYSYAPMTPLLRPFFTGGQINFSVDSTMKNERYN
jgi:Flp pilus assembly pilin Flp